MRFVAKTVALLIDQQDCKIHASMTKAYSSSSNLSTMDNKTQMNGDAGAENY